MRKIKLPTIGMRSVKVKIKQRFNGLSDGGFRYIFDTIDQLGIKKGVDRLGVDKFVNQCALLAAGSGIITGVGGAATIPIGVPLDLINIIAQQFRVTLAITYSRTGNCEIQFDEFFKVAATSMKGDAGVALTKTAMEDMAQRLMINMGAKTAKRIVPVIGAVIGGSANYFYIKSVAKSLKNIN